MDMIRPETRWFDEFQSGDFFLGGGRFINFAKILFVFVFSIYRFWFGLCEQFGTVSESGSESWSEQALSTLDCTLNKILYLWLVPLWVVRSIFHRSSYLFWWRPPWVDSPRSGCTWRWICRTCGTYFCPENTNDADFLAMVSNLMISQHGISDVTFSRALSLNLSIQ